ncbi:MAG TPA: HAD-IC family P-type ATPase [Kofleriaceae bacterium]|nr:HAD-IC family P-type ATPase [Kofleriaceae bacterium]
MPPPPGDATPWHATDAATVLAQLAADATRGLTTRSVAERRARFGRNELPAPPRRAAWRVWLAQFRSPLIYLLFGAAAIALALGEHHDALVIFIVVMLNAIIGAYQEGRAERALTALRQQTTQRVRAVRDGHDEDIDARELVPGDVISLAAGDAVPADARVLDHAALQLAEAALTGESLPIAKTSSAMPLDAVLAERSNMVYAGTHVTAGRARAVVVATGAATELGRIAELAEADRAPPTPLERRIARFGRALIVLAAASFALFVVIGLTSHLALGEILMVGISQVVGLIPEGLPVATTVALAVGVQRMARRRAIVRRLSAVETLGSTTVICSDKTGTLTCNEMTVAALWLPGRGEVEVTGAGYAPHGALRGGLDPAGDVERLLEAGVLCNDAHVLAPDAHEARWRAVGDPTEAALITLALKAGLIPDAIRAAQPRRAELPFDAEAKLMATQHATATGARVVLKGAPEAILALCGHVRAAGAVVALDAPRRAALDASLEAMAGRALRLLAIAEVIDDEIDGEIVGEIVGGRGAAGFAGRATLLGVIGQLDPPRAEAAAAVASCVRAGIRPVMVTGDHKATGLAIARTLGIARGDDLALDGHELAALDDDALAAQLPRIRVFARVHPAQKLRIVQALQRAGEVVAMTGDGVNDAPALVRADVGVAMGRAGTDVAKQAASVVITDDNFGSIVAAVEEGRVVHRNLKKAVLLLTSTSFAEMFILLIAVLVGYPAPFAAVQILWNNLLTEGVITVNLIMAPAEGDEMQRPPAPPGEPLITAAMWRRLLVMTPTIVVVVLGWLIFRLDRGVPFATVRTEAFTLLVVCEWFNVLNCLSDRRSALRFGVLKSRWLAAGLVVGNVLQLAVIYVPALNATFHTHPIPLTTALAIGAVASVVLWVEELRKLLTAR